MAAEKGFRGDAARFAERLCAVRQEAGLSTAQLAASAHLPKRRIAVLERGDDVPTEHELGVLAQSCGVAVFDLIPPGYSLRVLVHDPAVGSSEASGQDALDALLREYLSMVVELRSGNAVTAPSLRHDDLAELAATLGDTPEAIEARLVELLGDDGNARAVRSMILPSSTR